MENQNDEADVSEIKPKKRPHKYSFSSSESDEDHVAEVSIDENKELSH